LAVAAESARPHHTLWGDAFVRLRRNRLAVVGAILIISLALASIIVPLISPYEFDEQNLDAVLEGPSHAHLLGTDGLGRDVFTRLFYGARTSLAVGIFTQLIVLAIGLPIGALAGYAGGKVDNLLMRFVDIVYAFPDLLLIILIRAILGGSIYMIFLAIGLVAWVNVARLVRGQILTLKQRDFATAARAMGGSGPYITVRHLLPNSLGPIIVLITFGIPRAIFAEAALSYIGIGVKPPTPSWGTMIFNGYQNIFGAPYLVVFPAIAVGILMLAFTFLGDGLRDALDPRERR
jgi:oligopeptide transport system permease protein